MKKFTGLSDFFLNATDEEKREIYLEVINKSIEMQNNVIEEVKLEEGTTEERITDVAERSV